jgi:SMI1 / KNR4 family (SUKH-1)
MARAMTSCWISLVASKIMRFTVPDFEGGLKARRGGVLTASACRCALASKDATMSLFKRRSVRGRVEPALHPSDEWKAMAVRLDSRGCSPEEITNVESDQGIRLPPNYRRFLELMGRDGGGLVGGSDLCCPDMLGLRQNAIDLLAENESVLQLPEDAVVFMMHQGYQFMYLQGDDPRVHWWTEGSHDSRASKVIADSLFDFLRADERSTILSPEQRESHRRSTATMRRLRFKSEVCLRCGAPLSWCTQMRWGPSADEPGRERIVGSCAACSSTFFRWADSPADQLREV